MFFLAPLTALAAACGAPAPQGAVTVQAPWARETTTGVTVSAGYGRIENSTGEDIRLVGAQTPVAGRVELHNVLNEGGVMRMRPVEGGLDIPAGGIVELRPGSYHLMLLELRQPLRAGESVPVTLNFASGPPVQATFQVRSAAQAAGGGGHE